ncbi:Hsp20/alpha crystallin family protein [Paenibacillus solisilvae]|uniref:Hsp20/alpha crystallin family protein n=1 Tax=Paenibacillus solisilvae TaxID=2486751 RepID=A0ABW0W575_9BACL
MASQWDELEKWMEYQQLPKGFDVFSQQDWVSDYVRKLMTKAMPAAASVFGNSKADIAETKRFITVTYPLGEDADLTEISLLVREDRLKLSGLKGGKDETIKLPKLVVARSCVARYDGIVLSIKLRKRVPRKRGYEAVIHLK